MDVADFPRVPVAVVAVEAFRVVGPFDAALRAVAGALADPFPSTFAAGDFTAATLRVGVAFEARSPIARFASASAPLVLVAADFFGAFFAAFATARFDVGPGLARPATGFDVALADVFFTAALFAICLVEVGFFPAGVLRVELGLIVAALVCGGWRRMALPDTLSNKPMLYRP